MSAQEPIRFWMAIAAWAATRENDYAMSTVLRFGIMPMFLFSATFYPISAYPPALQAVVHVRALGGYPFKLVLITNGTGLDLPHVLNGLKHFTRSDEIWIKLDGGTHAYLNKVNRADIPIEKILSNILLVGRQRPVVIQSLFPAFQGEEPRMSPDQGRAARSGTGSYMVWVGRVELSTPPSKASILLRAWRPSSLPASMGRSREAPESNDSCEPRRARPDPRILYFLSQPVESVLTCRGCDHVSRTAQNRA